MSVYDLQGLKDETAYEAQASTLSGHCCNPSNELSSFSASCYHSNA